VQVLVRVKALKTCQMRDERLTAGAMSQRARAPVGFYDATD